MNPLNNETIVMIWIVAFWLSSRQYFDNSCEVLNPVIGFNTHDVPNISQSTHIITDNVPNSSSCSCENFQVIQELRGSPLNIGTSPYSSNRFSKLSNTQNSPHSTFLKLDVEDFIKTCAVQFKDETIDYTRQPTHVKPLLHDNDLSSPNTISHLPKTSKRKKKDISNSTSVSFLIPDKIRKRNKRHCLPGERKMLVWKWNKVKIKNNK